MGRTTPADGVCRSIKFISREKTNLSTQAAREHRRRRGAISCKLHKNMYGKMYGIYGTSIKQMFVLTPSESR